MAHSMRRPPSRSPSTPNMGAASEPRNWREAKVVRRSTEPVLTMTYQPRMSVSISNAQEVRRSAGSWKRKLRIRKTVRINGRGLSSLSAGSGQRVRTRHEPTPNCYTLGHAHVLVPHLLRLGDHPRVLDNGLRIRRRAPRRRPLPEADGGGSGRRPRQLLARDRPRPPPLRSLHALGRRPRRPAPGPPPPLPPGARGSR